MRTPNMKTMIKAALAVAFLSAPVLADTPAPKAPAADAKAPAKDAKIKDVKAPAADAKPAAPAKDVKKPAATK